MSISELKPIKTVFSKFKNVGTVIFLHGPGDTGPNFLYTIQKIIGEIEMPHLKFIFPTAPKRPYSLIDGKLSTIWFDKLQENPQVKLEDKKNMKETVEKIKKLLDNEIANGIPLNKIIVGGFSMGGCMALNIGYRFVPGLAGVFALSTYLHHNSLVYKTLKSKVKAGTNIGFTTPLFMAHGFSDPVVPVEWARFTFKQLELLKIKGEFFNIVAEHQLEEFELKRLINWINTVIPVQFQ